MNNNNTVARLLETKEVVSLFSEKGWRRVIDAIQADEFVGVFNVDGRRDAMETGNGLVMVTATRSVARGVVWTAFDVDGELIESGITLGGLLNNVAD